MKLFFFLLLVWMWQIPGLAQDQNLADSLEERYLQKRFTDAEQFELLKTLAEEQNDLDKKLQYANILIDLAISRDSMNYVTSGYIQKGNALKFKGNLSDALQSYFEAARIAVEQKNTQSQGAINVAIADVYSTMGNHERAVTYYRDGFSILQEVGDSVGLATAFLNAGDEYFNYGELDSALLYFERSGEIFSALDYEVGYAYNLGNIGLVYAQHGRHKAAEENITRAVEILERLGDYYPISVYFTYMSDIYLEKGDMDKALDFAYRSLELARLHGLKEQISDANLQLSELYEAGGDTDKAFGFYREYINYRDSVNNISAVQQMANMRADYEVSQKQAEVDLLNAERKNQRLVMIIVSILLALIVILAIGLLRRNRFIRKTSALIQKEKERSDRLLLNILPEETAAELKEKGKVVAKKYESVSVLFADFTDFTQFAEKSPPEELVQTVDYYFSKFDELMDKYGLEKIKTIGDSFMAAGGLPFPTDDHAIKIVRAAMEMITIVEEARRNPDLDVAGLEIRIGINSGPVIAGVVGIKKFAYDIWGDTVNIAARMESNSEVGRINISENTYNLIRDHFECSSRGALEVKNRGIMKMYFVDQAKTESPVPSFKTD